MSKADDPRNFITIELDEAILIYIAFSCFMGLVITAIVLRYAMWVLS